MKPSITVEPVYNRKTEDLMHYQVTIEVGGEKVIPNIQPDATAKDVLDKIAACMEKFSA